MTIIAVGGNTIRNCVAAARRELGVSLPNSRETSRSGHHDEDSLYRVELASGDVVECTIHCRRTGLGVEIGDIHE